MGYRPSKADSGLWIIQKGEGENKWYKYIAPYVDDVLVFSKDPMAIISKLQTLKGIGAPCYYLGGDILKLANNGHLKIILLKQPYLLKHI